MSLSLENLDQATRQFMADEIESDVQNGTLYVSPRLSDVGRQDYPNLLMQAAQQYDDNWLAQNLRFNGRISAFEQRRTPKGGVTSAKVPITAADTLAQGEFNRFYIRGVCRRAIENGINEVIIYRAKHVTSPRPDSQAKIGAKANAQALLNDLRAHPGVDTALGLPAGPNSGLSVKLP